MPMPPWSYSDITLFDLCPKKYYHLKVAKDVVEPPGEHLLYGSAVHAAAENYIKDGTPIPPAYAFIQPYLDKLNAIPGEKLVEYKMGVTIRDGVLQPCDFAAPEVWYRGIADLIILDRPRNRAWIVDYKTGKSSKFADMKQLSLMAACVFIHFPEIEFVKCGLLFVVAKDFITEEFRNYNKLKIFVELDKVLVARQTAFDTQVFNPKTNFTCKNWCPVMSCAHNGRKP